MIKTILVTGAAGFIGEKVIEKLLSKNDFFIIGIDNLNSYYDISLKKFRLNVLKQIKTKSKFIFYKLDIFNKKDLELLFKKYKFNKIIHLAAQAGVRYSLVNPDSYINSNIIGFYNILELCRKYTVRHLIYASSSSVYGGNKKIPFSVDDKVDNPVSLYAATKKTNELMAYTYSKLYNIPTTGLRFFTVYGPMGRPDMAYFSFTDKLVHNKKIKIFNYGKCKRDFTYIDDVVNGIIKVANKAPIQIRQLNGKIKPPYKIYNIGNSHPENLMDFINILCEELIKFKVLPSDFNINNHIKLVPMQPGDVAITYADVSTLEKDFNYKPTTTLRNGLRKFAKWYYSFYIKEKKHE